MTFQRDIITQVSLPIRNKVPGGKYSSTCKQKRNDNACVHVTGLMLFVLWDNHVSIYIYITHTDTAQHGRYITLITYKVIRTY